MSFACDLKQEIAGVRLAPHALRVAQAYGLLLFARSFSVSSVAIQTEHEATARLFCDAIVDLIGIKTSILYSEYPKRDGGVIFSAVVEAEEDRVNILRFFGHSPGEVSLRIRRENLPAPEAEAAFVAGVFLACGNSADPASQYHIEFVTPHLPLCQDLIALLGRTLEAPRMARRRSSYVVYLKEREAVEDLMTYMGGQKSALRTMDISIYKEMRNKVNRVTNCETANIGKTVDAALSQVGNIEEIIRLRGMEYLPEDLRELARLRLDNPDMSLRDLGEALSEPLSRSGVNHRLRRIAALAQELREGKPRPGGKGRRPDSSGQIDKGEKP